MGVHIYKLWAFKQFNMDEKCELATEDGTYLASRENKTHEIHLYNYGDIYLEIFFNKVTSCFERSTILQSPKKLDKYLDSIVLDSLFE